MELQQPFCRHEGIYHSHTGGGREETQEAQVFDDVSIKQLPLDFLSDSILI